jgi:hypothetical protein
MERIPRPAKNHVGRLLDIGLPKVNGYEACQRTGEQVRGRAMVLIAVTG